MFSYAWAFSVVYWIIGLVVNAFLIVSHSFNVNSGGSSKVSSYISSSSKDALTYHQVLHALHSGFLVRVPSIAGYHSIFHRGLGFSSCPWLLGGQTSKPCC